MRNLIIAILLLTSLSSFASCISGIDNTQLDTISVSELSEYTTLIQNVENCNDDVLEKLKKILAIQSSVRSDELRAIYEQIPDLQAKGRFDSKAKIIVNRDAIKLARRQAALALVKSEINSRKIKSLSIVEGKH